MKIRVLAVGTRMPAWVTEGCHEYTKRLPPELALEWHEIPLGKRARNQPVAKAIAEESERMLKAIGRDDQVVALDVQGKALSTQALAGKLSDWQQAGRPLTLLVGGPDGLSDDCRARADLHWSLSALTLPHPLVRIVLAEQLYRAWTILSGHPYHK
ncbi:MAG: 23S rRNA (pseudouridine(1915)-N(3))-methyltransferase RlmH [Gammaproteobacteria bacterium]|nr:MAG: 23S rRNA (pseudouridine(1915)-N(3))-methyltransferase RlmH [Gammaproteobacteria bacterium]